MRKKNELRSWLLTVASVIFVLQLIMLPIAFGVTYASGNLHPEHTLTYTTGTLTWDGDTPVLSDGTAQLSLFDAAYLHVAADNGEKVVAPGTEAQATVRLKNSTGGTVAFTAVLYRLRTSQQLPVTAQLSGDGLTDTERYTLPEGVSANAVIRAVTGSVRGSGIQDLDIGWLWLFEDGRDTLDTLLGDQSAAGQAQRCTLGVYITVEDDNVPPDRDPVIRPEGSPKTGDSFRQGLYIAAMAVSGVLLVVLIAGKRRRSDESESHPS